MILIQQYNTRFGQMSLKSREQNKLQGFFIVFYIFIWGFIFRFTFFPEAVTFMLNHHKSLSNKHEIPDSTRNRLRTEGGRVMHPNSSSTTLFGESTFISILQFS